MEQSTDDIVSRFIAGDIAAFCPDEAYVAAKRSLLDLIGVLAAGRRTRASAIAHTVAAELWPAGAKRSTMLFDGRPASPAGAAFAGAATIDSMDAHDGYKPAKGHAGVAVLPALVAVIEAEDLELSAEEFLAALIIGYEISCRVATVQHASCPDYHASGSWNAVGVAAVSARLLRLTVEFTAEALGIAEYFAPRSQMMRVIDHPTMVKDSSSWGAMTGVTAAYLAAAGFTGAPAVTTQHRSSVEVWHGLGSRWLIAEQYFKRWPVCRWAQAAVAAALELRASHSLDHRQLRRVKIETFREARLLAGHSPSNTEEAQYAIAFPTACAFVRGAVGVDEVAGTALHDDEILTLSRKVELIESAEFNAAFPARRFTRLVVEMNDGQVFRSPTTEPPGDPECPLPDEELIEKFQSLAEPVLGKARTAAILAAVGPLRQQELDVTTMLTLLRGPVETHVTRSVTFSKD